MKLLNVQNKSALKISVIKASVSVADSVTSSHAKHRVYAKRFRLVIAHPVLCPLLMTKSLVSD